MLTAALSTIEMKTCFLFYFVFVLFFSPVIPLNIPLPSQCVKGALRVDIREKEMGIIVRLLDAAALREVKNV